MEADCETSARIKEGLCLDEKGMPREGLGALKYFGRCYCIYDEDRLLLIVLLAGALGALVHGLRSLSWYVGNRRAIWSWSAMYFLLPFLGSGLAVIFYLVIRGGFFSPTATVNETSPFGFAALAALIGMFTEPAVTKLRKVAINLLDPPDEGKDHVAPAPKVNNIAPKQGSVDGGDTVTITGEGFSTDVAVYFGGAKATVTDSSETSIVVTTPKHEKGKVNVEVLRNGQQALVKDGFEYLAAGGEAPKPTNAEPPTITSLSLELGGAAGGDAVTITGTNFSQEPAATVMFGGTPAVDIQVKGPTSIEVKTPPHAAGTVNVTVKNPDDNEAVKIAAYTFW
jgi:hypothetical protein